MPAPEQRREQATRPRWHVGGVSAEADDALAYLQEQGFEVRIERRDLHAVLVARGRPGQASFYAEGRDYHCVDLLREGVVVWADVAVGETEGEAIVGARRWYDR
jgi:hypothetical protein